MQAPLVITRAGQLFGQWAGPHAGSPDYGLAFQMPAISQRHAVGIHGGYGGADDPFDAQLVRGFDD
ncbi:hypothetical protein D3C80_2109660 [compost metagenome]